MQQIKQIKLQTIKAKTDHSIDKKVFKLDLNRGVQQGIHKYIKGIKQKKMTTK